ncbi:MAG: D-alanyl-D-alanine carboxypeptidase [Candidatus Andersenbacteria bacterium]|nr:D-alanyl-D-alanine carboxypeptidase [Candidatus Andersenbacteria bacterium]MBI3250304.1 D-alanyl-D-alanine carboxypeptidase [Candidatus Andersenbacteria bacterium]
MTLTSTLVAATFCALLQQPLTECVVSNNTPAAVAGIQTITTPQHTGEAVDVVLTAQAAIVWDVATGTILYEKNADSQRPVASLSKLVSALTIRSLMAPATIVEISPAVRSAQLSGANIKLPIGQHATVQELLEAGMIASANDAMVALAEASSGSEQEFVTYANAHAAELGLSHTQLANATGLEGGTQYSTARDIMQAMKRVYSDSLLRSFMDQKSGVLVTEEGARRAYETTNDLIGTYMPILAGKTGYTLEAGENLTIITRDSAGHTIGAVVLGSDQRFQDMKVLVEWVWRNYTWHTL